MEELHREIALWVLNAHSQKPTTNTLGKSYGKCGSWCGWLGGHLSERGRVGSPWATILTSCPCTTRWGLQSRGQPPCPPAPIQPDEDVGCLINSLAMGLWLSTPQINTFSGNAMPGKMEVSFEKCYHEVQCVKDHYPESVVRESIIHSLKGVAADMARYMGPTTSMAHILQNLTIIFSTIVSFDVLMQNVYKVTQSNHEKVPSFATRLEGTLNQIWLQCPRRIMDWEVQQHLKDCLFHGVSKHIRDSVCYLYSNLETIYSQLMVIAHKAERKKWRGPRQGVG